VTIIAAKEETFPELNDAGQADRQRDSTGCRSDMLGTCIALLKSAGVHARCDGRASEAHQDFFRRHHPRLDAAKVLGKLLSRKHRRDYRRCLPGCFARTASSC